MKTMSVLIVSMLVCGVAPSAEPQCVRPLDSVASEALDRGLARSETFRALVAGLQGSDLIVHVITRRDLPSQLAGMTRFVTDRGASRYVRVELAAWLSANARVSVLGHELQHASEIASSGIRTTDGLVAFYKAAGRQAVTIENGWETTAAEVAERRVWIELTSRGHLAARAVE